MKKTAAAASALALGTLSTPAHAQDAAGDHDWSGFYVGGSAGLTSAQIDWEIDGGEGFIASEDGSVHGSEKPSTGSIRVGYNDQVGSIVVGAELDYSLVNFDEFSSFDGGEGALLHSDMQGFGSLRGRVGYATGNLLCFVTAGIALGDMEHQYDSQSSNSQSPVTESTSIAGGWIAGGGLEFAVTENVSLVAEGVYATFYEEATAQGISYSDKFEVEVPLAIGRIGLNFSF